MSIGKQIKTRKLDRAGWKRVWHELRVFSRGNQQQLRATLERQASGMFGSDHLEERFVASHAPTKEILRHADGQISLLGARARAPGWYWPRHINGGGLAYPARDWRSYSACRGQRIGRAA